MRVLITGVDDHGRSCVVEERTPSVQAFESGGITVAAAAATESCPPPVRPPGRGDLLEVAATPGTARWSFIGFPPGATTPFHHTDSVDFDVVLEGSVDVILDDGRHRLRPGDGVVINGVDHRWETHEEGCQMSVVVIATPPLGVEDPHGA
jgi:quercetin dioxygenase-like cupin family protein